MDCHKEAPLRFCLSSFANAKGLSLIEVIVTSSIAGVLMMAMMAMQQHQLKLNNYLEFQLKRNQLQNTLIGQVLNDPSNCACLFNGAQPFAADPTAPGATLTGVSPTQIGEYEFGTPGDCTTATMPVPLVNNTGIDGIRTTAIRLTNIMNVAGSYNGDLLISLESTKQVAGPKSLPIRIPVYALSNNQD